jgi:hypothetical protein
MNIIDENIPEDQRQLLRGWRIRVRQIGHEVGRSGMQDAEIIPLLHAMESSTFFTRDLGFYRRHLCHSHYCIVCLAVSPYEAASFKRRPTGWARSFAPARWELLFGNCILTKKRRRVGPAKRKNQPRSVVR